MICRAATPVWKQQVDCDLCAVSTGGAWNLLGLDKDGMAVFDRAEDATFACSARQNMPRLLAEVRRQKKEIAALKQNAEAWRERWEEVCERC